MESKMNTYTIDEISEDCYDLYVSDDDGYTWEYFATYTAYIDAVEDAEAVMMIGANRA
jgi:hypothetical protein